MRKLAPAQRDVLVLAAVTLIALLPFFPKAYHIDDPVYLWVAEHVVRHPTDPYGFDIVWYTSSAPVSTITKNPPLSSYAMALWSFVAGWSELSMHAFTALSAVATVVGTHRLARSLDADENLAGFATLAAPVFIVSATTVMCDVPMLAAWVWALVYWVEGLEEDSLRKLLLAAFLAGISALTKYFGVALLPLMLAHGLIRRRRPGLFLLPLGLAVAMLVAYQRWSAALYGRGLLLDAAGYATSFGDASQSSRLERLLVGLAFAGGGAPIALLAGALGRGRPRRHRALLLLGALALLVLVIVLVDPVRVRATHGPALALQSALFLVAGVAGVALAADELRRAPRDAGAWLLALWVGGTLFFAAVANWTTNGRSVLPLAPALAILLGRGFRRAGLGVRAALLPVASSLLLALAVAWGDAALADADREATIALLSSGDPKRTWFQGHWGFQLYMQQGGARPVDVARGAPVPGDRVIVPLDNTNVFPLPRDVFRRERVLEVPVDALVATMSRARAAGFYAALWGKLPYSFGRPPPQRFTVYRVSP